MSGTLPPGIPSQLHERRRDLSALGSADTAWEYQDALQVIEALTGSGVAILGGDVYYDRAGTLVHTSDNWSCERSSGESKQAYALRSQSCAADYLRRYRQADDIPVIVALTLNDSATAGM
jgi:hypothetical protein